MKFKHDHAKHYSEKQVSGTECSSKVVEGYYVIQKENISNKLRKVLNRGGFLQHNVWKYLESSPNLTEGVQTTYYKAVTFSVSAL